jgi:predicted Zn-dependent peptidase
VVPTALLLGALAGAASAQAPPDRVPRHPSELIFPPARWRAPVGGEHRRELASGAVLYLVEDRSLPLVEVVIATRAGAFLDPEGRPGASYLMTQLLPRGGTEALPAAEFDAEVERVGAHLTASWTPSFAALGLSVPSWALAPALNALLELLQAPGFHEANLHALRSNLLEGMARRNDDPVEVIEREWESLLYGSDHFSTRALTPAAVGALSRQDLLAFHRRWWRPRDFVIAAAGDFDAAMVAADIERRLAAWPAADDGPIQWPPPPPGTGATPGLYLLPETAAQAKVLLGHRLPAVAAADRSPLALLAEVLGGSGAIARIQGRLRTAEGLAYRSAVRLEIGDLWPGDLRVFFETRSDQAARAATLAIEELNRVREQLVPAAELAAARQNLLSVLRRSFDTPEEIAGYLAENALLGRPEEHWETHRAGLEAVTPEDLRRVARAYLHPDALTVLALGADGASRDQLAHLLGRAPVELPARDPLTLEPLAPTLPRQSTARPPSSPPAAAPPRPPARPSAGSRARGAASRAPGCRGR